LKKPGAVPVPVTEGGAGGEGATGGAVLARPTGVSAVGNHVAPPTAAGRSGPGTDASVLTGSLKMGAVREAGGVHEAGGEPQQRWFGGSVGQGTKSSDCVAAIQEVSVPPCPHTLPPACRSARDSARGHGAPAALVRIHVPRGQEGVAPPAAASAAVTTPSPTAATSPPSPLSPRRRRRGRRPCHVAAALRGKQRRLRCGGGGPRAVRRSPQARRSPSRRLM